MAKWVNIILRWVSLARAANRERDRFGGKTTKRADPPSRQIERGVSVDYSPDLDGEADPGEVVWAWVPYEEDPNRGKDRPLVIIGYADDGRGRRLAGVPLTSKGKGRRDHVPVGTGAWDPKRRDSWAKVDRLIVLDQSDVRREGAVLARNRFDDVVGNLANHHDLTRS